MIPNKIYRVPRDLPPYSILKNVFGPFLSWKILHPYFLLKKKLFAPFLFLPKTALYLKSWKWLNVCIIVCILRQLTHSSHLTQRTLLFDLQKWLFWKMESWIFKFCSKKSLRPPNFISQSSFRGGGTGDIKYSMNDRMNSIFQFSFQFDSSGKGKYFGQ